MSEEKKVNPRREALIKASQEARELREAFAEQSETDMEAVTWMSQTLNYMLLNHIYDVGENVEFKTFGQWKKEGATIRKGEKSFVIWGQPISAQRKKEAEAKGETTEEDPDNFEYFPMCYLFGDQQVIMPEDRQPAKVQEPEPEVRETVELDEVL